LWLIVLGLMLDDIGWLWNVFRSISLDVSYSALKLL
jgi:hypothetical protein